MILVEVSLGCLQEWLRHKPPGIVDEDVEPAELLHRLDYEAACLCDLAYLRLDGDGLISLGLNACDYILSSLGIRSVIHHHDRSVFRQSLCDSPSYPAGRPGDDRDFSTE